MQSQELQERTEAAAEVVNERLGGSDQHLAVIPGTGWKEGLQGLFQLEAEVSYADLQIPGADACVEGHSKSLQKGTINGRPVLVVGRVHANEDPGNPDLPFALRIVLGAVSNQVHRLVITNGAGTLHGPIGAERGRLHSLVQTALLDLSGWMHTGRRKEPIKVGDMAIVTDVRTELLGNLTPLLAGEFIDPYHDGIHRDGDQHFKTGIRALQQTQGCSPQAIYRFITGPQFETPADKRGFRAQGDDLIGMSGVPDILAATRLEIPFINLTLATNGPFGKHDHAGNQSVGEANQLKTRAALEVLADTWQ